ncbi:MAG: hypothetical protein QM770_16835 [Tepidisphaeraceae bacterium]
MTEPVTANGQTKAADVRSRVADLTKPVTAAVDRSIPARAAAIRATPRRNAPTATNPTAAVTAGNARCTRRLAVSSVRRSAVGAERLWS